MGIASTVTSYLSGASGNIEKAYIVIKNPWLRGENAVTMENPVVVGAGSMLSSLKNLATKLLSTTIGDSEGAATYYVKFNPNSLRISGRGGGMEASTNFMKNGAKVEMEEGRVRISMSVQLLFDKTDNSDVFLADKLNTSTSALAVNAAKAALTLTGTRNESDYSVKGDVEAFLAALQQDKTREMAFCWGSIRYDGFLENVSARYTMFNPQGHPTRAEVSLSLICYGAYGIMQETSDWQMQNKAIWDDAYNETFKKGGSSLAGIGQKVGSLLNVKL